MVFTVLRASGSDFEVDRFLSDQQLDACSVWRKGEPRRSGSTHADSGFNLALPQADSWVTALSYLRDFIKVHAGLLKDLQSLGVGAELDIGIAVGEERSYAPSITVPNDVLTELSALGLTLMVSAYPTSDDV